MSLLRTCRNLHRGLRLLRRIAAERGQSDLDAIVQDAVANADDLAGRIDVLRAQHKKELVAQTAAFDARLKRYSRELRDQQSLVKELFAELSRELLAKQEQHEQVVHGTHKATMEQVANVSQSVSELNAQVAAVREYAARQHEQVKRLQEGYDWALLKGFCLRIIRCIDDIEERIDRAGSTATKDALVSTRDGLVFALQASGVEQFLPECGVEYRGHEKSVEVVGRRPSSEAAQVGRIAKVIRVGYQVFVSDEVTRVVRPAKVEVFVKPEGGENG